MEVEPRIAERRLAVRLHGGSDPETEAALAAQEEALVSEGAVAVAHLVPGAVPAPDWSRLLLDAHAEGWAAVGSALEPDTRGERRRLAAWAPGGRNPRLGAPLLLPSLLDGLEPGEHDGLPAFEGEDGALRRPRRRQTSTAIRSSERVKTNAPNASATSAPTTV